MRRAKELGVDSVMTGDGADELFGGYSFMWNTDLEDGEWVIKRNMLVKNMSFSTNVLSSLYGLHSFSPYLEESFIDWAIQNTNENDCIGELDIEYIDPNIQSTKYDTNGTRDHIIKTREKHKTGKICLRKAFPDSGSAFRRKDPIEVGSGCTQSNIIHYLMASTFSQSDFELQKSTISMTDKVEIRDVEHLYYYLIFKQEFPQGLPEHERHGRDPCKCCGYKRKDSNEKFCFVCGAWPAC